jgi:protein-S-isoprenylcysteine O-methyltransferase Ste14
MEIVALAGFVLFVLLAFGLRAWVHYQRTGTTGFVGVSGSVGSSEWLGGALFVLALVAAAAAPSLQLAGWLAPSAALDKPPAHAAGLVLYAAGVAATLWSQFAMGESWRIGVDAAARTQLVATGPFRLVRNPIYSAMTMATVGLVLLVPNPMSVLALLALLLALEIQVRLVEEPYLARVHGSEYLRYAGATGRFLPGIGRLQGGERESTKIAKASTKSTRNEPFRDHENER